MLSVCSLLVTDLLRALEGSVALMPLDWGAASLVPYIHIRETRMVDVHYHPFIHHEVN
jgi:hypothetical protein